MIEAARNDGIRLRINSAYRSVSLQQTNFEKYYNNLINRGYTKERAFNLTAERIAIPRTSEHNAGLALDIGRSSTDFDKTAEFRWLSDNSYKYGFIMRYPADKVHITGIVYEPWHYRFVGLYHAEKIYNSGLTLEEYIGICAEDDTVADAFRQSFT